MKWLVSTLALTAAIAAFWPAAAGASRVTGIVVARQHGTLLVVSPAGALRAVHARASIGSQLVFAGSSATVVGRASRAMIRGIVVRRVGTTLILSSNHHLIAIPNRVGRRLSSASTTPSAPGAVVTTDVSLANGRLEEDDETEVGQVASNTIAVQATIKGVGAGIVTLDVQGQSISVSLPGGLTLPASLVGQTVTINLSLANDDQGDDDGGGDHHGGGDNSGPGGGDD
jgi:hypothetical protein